MVGVVGIIIKINSFFFQKPPGYETVSGTYGHVYYVEGVVTERNNCFNATKILCTTVVERSLKGSLQLLYIVNDLS